MSEIVKANTESEALAAYLKSLLGVHPDFPKKGIVFLDMFPILRNPVAAESLFVAFLSHLFSRTIPALPAGSQKIDVVVGLDSRGFLFGPTLAMRLGAAFVPVRKVGKLPGECFKVEYAKEYGTDAFELQKDAIKPGQTVIIVDDLIATGGSAKGAGELVKLAGGKTIEYLFIIEVEFLKGYESLDAPAFSIVKD